MLVIATSNCRSQEGYTDNSLTGNGHKQVELIDVIVVGDSLSSDVGAGRGVGVRAGR